MSKRFVDYYLQAVTKKSGGGGGSSVVMSDAYLPDKTFDWTVNASRTQFASIADLDAWFKSADETTPVYVAGYYPGMQEGNTILVNTFINPTGTEDYFEAYFWGVVKEFVVGSSMSVRMKAFEGYSVPSQGDKLNGATYIAQNGDFEGQTTGATLDVDVQGGGGGGPTIESKTITENGTYQESGKAYSPVTVNVAPKLQQRNVTVTDNGTTVIKKTSSAYDGISQVNLTVDVQGGGGGGATNIIEGSFNLTGIATENLITIPYQGSGFLKALLIYPDGGIANYPLASPVDSELGMLVAVKSDLVTPPTFAGTSGPDSAYLFRVYRSSSSWSRNGSAGVLFNANGTPAHGTNTALQLIIKDNVTFAVPSRSTSGTSRFALDKAVNWKYTAIYTE